MDHSRFHHSESSGVGPPPTGQESGMGAPGGGQGQFGGMTGGWSGQEGGMPMWTQATRQWGRPVGRPMAPQFVDPGAGMSGRGAYRGKRGRRGGGAPWNGEGVDGSRNTRPNFGSPETSSFGKKQEDNDAKGKKFYCCSCERGFRSQEQLDEHNKEHIVCGLDGCQFEAHSLVVTKHIRIQHEGNLYQRMKNLNTPEDIARWREERKKNYPTSNKAQQKDDELKEKLERREICGLPNRKAPRRPGSHPSNGPAFRYKIQPYDPRTRSFAEYERRMRKIEYDQSDEWMRRSFAPDINARHIRVPFFSMNKSKVVTLESFYMNVKKGKQGNGKLEKQTKVKWKGFRVKELDRLTDSESDTELASLPISDDEDEEDVETEVDSQVTSSAPSEGIKVANKLGGSFMLVDYSSASESDEQEDRECKGESSSGAQVSGGNVKEVLQSPVVGTTTGAKKTVKDSAPADEKKLMDAIVVEEFNRDPGFKHKPAFVKPIMRRRQGRPRTKLLETLLQEQIRKERNILLQTCRYVRENDFFGHK